MSEYGTREPNAPRRDDLTYNSYLKVPELLRLQQAQSDPPHHDEMLFIIIHQAYELWFKLVLHELENAIRYMDADKVLRAHHFVRRTVEIMNLLVSQIHILETMTPIEFLEFRDRLQPASGFQSGQFREIEFLAGLKEERYFTFFKNDPKLLETLRRRFDGPDLGSTYLEMLRRLGHDVPKGAGRLIATGDEGAKGKALAALKKIYENPEGDLPIYLLSESLVDLDEGLALWREHHVRVVERIIGFKRGTGGSSGVGYLQTTLAKKAFPLLWEVRTLLEKRP